MTPFYKNSLIYNDENMNAIIKYILQDEYVDGEYKINITKIRGIYEKIKMVGLMNIINILI